MLDPWIDVKKSSEKLAEDLAVADLSLFAVCQDIKIVVIEPFVLWLEKRVNIVLRHGLRCFPFCGVPCFNVLVCFLGYRN